MSDFTCIDCGGHKCIGVEYAYGSPEHYDGISEWECLACGTRVGRWSGKKLEEGVLEKRFGCK